MVNSSRIIWRHASSTPLQTRTWRPKHPEATMRASVGCHFTVQGVQGCPSSDWKSYPFSHRQNSRYDCNPWVDAEAKVYQDSYSYVYCLGWSTHSRQGIRVSQDEALFAMEWCTISNAGKYRREANAHFIMEHLSLHGVTSGSVSNATLDREKKSAREDDSFDACTTNKRGPIGSRLERYVALVRRRRVQWRRRWKWQIRDRHYSTQCFKCHQYGDGHW
jgi:hypothetical protein